MQKATSSRNAIIITVIIINVIVIIIVITITAIVRNEDTEATSSSRRNEGTKATSSSNRNEVSKTKLSWHSTYLNASARHSSRNPLGWHCTEGSDSFAEHHHHDHLHHNTFIIIMITFIIITAQCTCHICSSMLQSHSSAVAYQWHATTILFMQWQMSIFMCTCSDAENSFVLMHWPLCAYIYAYMSLYLRWPWERTSVLQSRHLLFMQWPRQRNDSVCNTTSYY